MNREEKSRIMAALLEYITQDRLHQWLKKPNREWGGRTPNALIHMDNTGPIWRLIGEVRDGYPF